MARSGICVCESVETVSGFGRLLRWKVRLEEMVSPDLIAGLLCGVGLHIRGDELELSLVQLHGMTLIFDWREDGLFDSMYSEVSQLFD
jgi:hypothetical protein